MKKTITIILVLALFAVLVLPVAALETYELDSKDDTSIHEIVTDIYNKFRVINGVAEIEKGSTAIFENAIFQVNTNGKLIVNGTLDGHIKTAYLFGTIEVGPDAVIKLSFDSVSDASEFYEMIGGDSLGARLRGNCVYYNEKGTGSVLSGGSLAIIVGVVCLAVGMAVMYFVMKKKKKPVLAETDGE